MFKKLDFDKYDGKTSKVITKSNRNKDEKLEENKNIINKKTKQKHEKVEQIQSNSKMGGKKPIYENHYFFLM